MKMCYTFPRLKAVDKGIFVWVVNESCKQSKLINRISYFRHDPKAVKSGGKCTYRDETYRHKLAKDIAQRIRQIKVPALYKYAPKNVEGASMLLKKAEVIRASSVGIDKVFCEDQFGEIKFGKKDIIDEQQLIFKPDITFFDGKNEPILFIQIVATHKIGIDKLVKLKRLGINTVQIKIPKDSPQKIEESFHQTAYTKWVYNHVEENTKYIRVPNSHTEGVPPIDELQRKFFEESARCRLAQIGSLIRTIDRCLESEPYQNSERSLRSSISRIEANTERNRQRLELIREERREKVGRRFEERFRRIKDESTNIEQLQRDDGLRYQELEDRYYSKRKSIEEDEEIHGSRFHQEIERLGGEGSTVDERKAILREETERIERSIRTVRKELEGILRRRSELQSRYDRIREQLDNEIVEKERRTIKAIESRDITETDELSREIKATLQTGELIVNFQKAQSDYQRYRAAWECFKTGTWKNWPR